jgi:oligopeptide transport system substrate-binding protein
MPSGGRAFRIPRPIVLAVVFLAVAVAVVALATRSSDDGTVGPARTTTTRPSGEVVEGGTMRLGLSGPLQADPAAANLGSPTDMLVLDLLHDGLTRLGDAGVVVPALATEWTPDATFTTWVFKLDPAATFASGRAVTSADVVASLERVAKHGDTSLAALSLEAIAGYRAFVDGSAEHVAGLTAPDPATVQIVVTAPMSVLPVLLASPVFGVVDIGSLDAAVAADAGAAALADLDTDGAWAVASAEDSAVTLERRDGEAGHLEAIELRSYDDGDTAYDAFDDGDVDWALVPVDRFDDASNDYGDAAFTPFHAELFFGLHVTTGNAGNAEMRKAIAAAIDRDAIVAAIYADRAEPLATVVPEGVPGYEPGRCATCGHDPDRARAILAAAFPDGRVPAVAIDFDESPAQTKMAGMVADQLLAVGIQSVARPKPIEEYKQFLASGAQELFSFGWIGGYVSPDAYLAPLFGSIANDNLTGYGTSVIDGALAAARSTSDAAAAQVQWAAVEAQVLGEGVVVPIAQFRIQAVLGERVQGFAHAVDGSVDWSAVWVADGE